MRLLILALLLAGCTGEEPPDPSAHTVILLADSAQGTLDGTITGELADNLRSQGFSLISIDLPCTGAERDPDFPNVFSCWRSWMSQGDMAFFDRFCAKLSAAIDTTGKSDVSIVGMSRGAYASATCAAGEPRIRRFVLLKPLTDLSTLWEFDGFQIDARFDLHRYIPALANRPSLVRIGSADARVDTSKAVAFGQAIGATVEVTDDPGHDLADNGAAGNWLRSML